MYTGILLILIHSQIGIIFFLSKKKKKKEDIQGAEEIKDSLICKFVFDGADRKIGESLAVEDDILIIKSGKKYLGIPLKHVEVKEKTLLVKGLIEQDKAEKMGKKWQQESLKEIDICEQEND